jgi:hypothetical protein
VGILVLCVVLDSALKTKGFIYIFGLVLVLFIPTAVASYIGDSVPIKSTVMSHPELQVLSSIGSGDGNQFYLEHNQKDDSYTYQVGDIISTEQGYKVKLVFDAPMKPYVEFVDNYKDYSNGQQWKWLFGVRDDPLDLTVIHVSQGSVFVVPKSVV